MVSWPVPPTLQSLPRSPKRTSLPSVFMAGSTVVQLPWLSTATQAEVRWPDVQSLFKKNCRALGALPASPFHGVPSVLNRIARRGSYSS
jgi:hypothetical protein